MLEKIKSIHISKIVRLSFILIVAFRMCCHLFYATEKEFQTFRDLEMYESMILLCMICVAYRGIKISDYIAWVYALIGFGAQLGFLK